MHRLFVIAACFCLVPGAMALDGNIAFEQLGDIPEIVSRLKSANPGAEIVPPLRPAPAQKEWTVMVYVNAKNNLEAYGLADVNEMEMVGSGDNVNIVAELGRIAGYSSSDGNWKTTRRYLIRKDDDTERITSLVQMEMETTDMGDWNHLAEFAKWAMGKYPAKHYALVVWNHGSGWNKDQAFDGGKGISYDSETGNNITTPELRAALKQIGKIDIFAMDACLMQMIEVAYEVKDYTDYVVASEETEPADGYTYNTWLGPLAEKPGMPSSELAAVMVNSYGDYYQSAGREATQSAVKTGAFGRFTELLNGWTSEVMNAGELAAARNARADAQSFYYPPHKDVYHFIKLLNDAALSPAVQARGKTLLDFIKSDVIVANRALGLQYAAAAGLAIYLPDNYDLNYDTLKWAAASNWPAFTKWIK